MGDAENGGGETADAAPAGVVLGPRGGRLSMEEIDRMFTLKVDNIPFSTSLVEVRDLFSPFGEVGDVHLPVRRRKKKSGAGDEEVKMGYAFVRFLRKEDMDQCINTFKDAPLEIGGRTLQVCQAERPKAPVGESARRTGGAGGAGGGQRAGGGQGGSQGDADQAASSGRREDRGYERRDDRGYERRDDRGYERGGYSRDDKGYERRDDRDRGYERRESKGYERRDDRGYERRRSRSRSPERRDRDRYDRPRSRSPGRRDRDRDRDDNRRR
jgi:RNA recognition motif-containing protein